MTRTFDVIQTVEVTVDETQFTEEFMEDFRQTFYDHKTIEDHMKHLAQLEARGMIGIGNDFIEGYGPMSDMGLSMKVVDTEIEEA